LLKMLSTIIGAIDGEGGVGVGPLLSHGLA
jgi:hypothetical protein